MLDLVYKYWLFFLEGLLVSLELSGIGLAMGFAIGWAVALAEVFGGRLASKLAIAYEELIRGTPMIVQLFAIYFGLPMLGLERFQAACLALGINSGAYQAGYFKSALEAVTRDQMDAALSVGMRVHQAITHIILPQALRISLPGWASEFAVVIKDSSYAFLLGLMDLMRSAELLRASLLAMGLIEYLIIPYAIAALIYFAFTFPISRYLASWAVRKRVELGL